MNQTDLLRFERGLAGHKILVTGNTGFTGGWVCQWLRQIGVEVSGFSLPPDTEPSRFHALGHNEGGHTVFGDVCDYDAVLKREEMRLLKERCSSSC